MTKQRIKKIVREAFQNTKSKLQTLSLENGRFVLKFDGRSFWATVSHHGETVTIVLERDSAQKIYNFIDSMQRGL